jgi:septum formation topological specificity factor MinE
MKRFQQQLKKKAETLKLSAAEKRDLRERLVAYMEYHPLPSKQTATTTRPAAQLEQRAGEPFVLVSVRFGRLFRALGGVAVLFLIITPVLAERAVPGDVLYPIKVRVNEEVRSSLALSPYQKVEWETERLERRIAEARLLASAGKLTPEVEAEVVKAVQKHTESANEEIASIRATDSEEAALVEISLASALAVQSEVLEGDIKKDQATSTAAAEGRSVALLAGAVDEARATAEAARETAMPSVAALLARIESETTRAEELFASVNGAASQAERISIDRRLTDIKRTVNRALEIPESADTASRLAAALTDTRKLISYLTDIDVRKNVSIDELIPSSLTDAEYETLLEERVASIATLTDAARSTTDLPVDVADKVTVGLAAIDELLAKASTSTAAQDYGAADVATSEALALAEDIATLVATDTAPVVPTDEEVATSTEGAVSSGEETVTEPDESDTETLNGSESEPVEGETATDSNISQP